MTFLNFLKPGLLEGEYTLCEASNILYTMEANKSPIYVMVFYLNIFFKNTLVFLLLDL